MKKIDMTSNISIDFLLENVLTIVKAFSENKNSEFEIEPINKIKGVLGDSEFISSITNHPDAPISKKFPISPNKSFLGPRATFKHKDNNYNFFSEDQNYKKYDNIILLSGGLDSYIANWYVKEYLNLPGSSIFVDYGQSYAEAEIDSILSSGIECNFIRFKEVEKLINSAVGNFDYIIPMRNLFLCAIAARFVNPGGRIWFCPLDGEGSETTGDKSIRFIENISKGLSDYFQKEIKVHLPFYKITKTELVKFYLDNNGNPEEIKKRVSCYYVQRMVDTPCGYCSGCGERFILDYFLKLNEKFKRNPKEFYINKYLQGLYNKIILKNNKFYFSDNRAKEIWNAIFPESIPKKNLRKIESKFDLLLPVQ